MKFRLIALLSLAAAGSVVAATITAVPPLENSGSIAAPRVVPRMLLPDSAPARGIDLGLPTPAETAKAAAKASASTAHGDKPGGVPLRVGFARTIPASAARIRLADLPWQSVAGGGTAARLALTSTGAAALRLGIRLIDAPAGLAVRFQGSGVAAQTFGPVMAGDLPAAYPYWSPSLSGERAIVEFALPAGLSAGNAMLQMPLISHLFVDPASAKAAPDPFGAIGQAGSCEMDVACVSNPSAALLSAASSVVRLAFTYQGSTYLCSGTLLNDAIGSHAPYIYTGNHCIDDPGASNEVLAASTQAAEAASSTNSYWFFQAATCGSLATPNYVLLTGGAKLLARGFDYDWALLQLEDAAPSGAAFSAWRATALSTGTGVDALHHPEGDLTKLSIGSVQDYVTYFDGSSFIEAQWTKGVTEPGSSGSGLFTLSPDGTAYELRGGLYGGDSSCAVPAGLDQYSRLDNAIALLAQYLTPNVAPSDGAAPVVEFYNAALDDYFMTIDPGEISDLDTGVHPGWIRTGYRFLAYTSPAGAPVGVSPVCRFYVQPAVGDSHFYSADPAECAATQAKFAGQWAYESPAVFYILLPDMTTGACPVNSRPVYRFLNNANGLHHRYTAEVDLRDVVNVLDTWTQEGYGNPPDQVVMCSPNT